MSWDTERAASGRRPFEYVEVFVDRCTRVYGDAFDSPAGQCTAALGTTGEDKCYNSFETCQDPDNFNPEEFALRFCSARDDIPRSFSFTATGLPVFLPLLERIEHTNAKPDPGESIGVRATLEIELRDAPHHDRGIDKYVDERLNGSASSGSGVGAFDPQTQGTLLGKLRARWPHYLGRRIVYYQGFITDSPAEADFRKREYVLERMEGPDADGRARLVAKDPLKLADDERAQQPAPSTGVLDADIAENPSPEITTIDVVTSTPSEYPSSGGYVFIGREGFTYTGRTDLTGGVSRLTGVTRTLPDGYETERESHDAGDAVQLAQYYMDQSLIDVVEDLLVNVAGISSAFVPKATDWTDEYDKWLPGLTVRRMIAEPTGVKELVEELVQQNLVWGFWWDDVAQQIQFRAVRPADTAGGDTVKALSDDANLIADSVRVEDEPDRLVNEVQVLYGQRNPFGKRDEVENYRRAFVVVDADSQSANEANQRRVKRIYARWHPTANESRVGQFGRRTLAARVRNLRAVEFEVDAKDAELQTGGFADLTTRYLQDEFGRNSTFRVQVIRTDAERRGQRARFLAREDFFQGRYLRIAPASLQGVAYADGSASEKELYGAIAVSQALGELSDGTEGWLIL